MCLKAALETAPVQALLQVLRGDAWRTRLDLLPGYDAARCGEVLSLRQQLPWWEFRPRTR